MEKFRKGRFWRWCKRGISGSLFLGIVAGSVFVDHPFLAFGAEKAEDEWRRAGLPWEMTELHHEVLDSENAVVLVRESGAISNDFSWWHTHEIDEARKEGLDNRALYLEASYYPALDTLVEASKLPEFRTNPNLDLGDELTITEHNTLYRGALMLIERAVESKIRSGAERIADIEAVYRLGNLVGKEELVCSQGHQQSIDQALFIGVMNMLNTQELSAAELETLEEVVRGWEYPVDLGGFIPGEAYRVLFYLRNCPGLVYNELQLPVCIMTTEGAYTPRGPWTNDRHSGLPEGIEKRALFVRGSRFYVGLTEAARLNRGDPLSQGRAMDAVWNREVGIWPSLSGFTLSMLDSGDYYSYAVRLVETQFLLGAMREAVRAKLTIVRDSEMLDIVAIREKLRDPFSNSGPRVTIEDGVMKIYTLGDEGIDEGGPDSNERFQSRNTGVVLELKK